MRRHSVDPLSLLFGLVFAAVGVVFMVGSPRLVDVRLQWLWPAPLILLGIVIVAMSWRQSRAGREAPQDDDEAAG